MEETTTAPTQWNFEQAMSRLETIVDEMENGGLPLEDLIARFDEGVRLSQVCDKRLEEAEQKIEQISQAADGTLQTEPFDPGRTDESGDSGESSPQASPGSPSKETSAKAAAKSPKSSSKPGREPASKPASSQSAPSGESESDEISLF